MYEKKIKIKRKITGPTAVDDSKLYLYLVVLVLLSTQARHSLLPLLVAPGLPADLVGLHYL